MGYSIGDVNFSLDADTQGLKNSITELKRFSRQVDAIVKKTQDLKASTVSAYARQESAIKKAYQQTLNLKRSLKGVGAPASEISRLTRSFSTLTKEMSSGKLSTLEYTRALDAFNTRLGRSQRAFKELRTDKATRNTSKLATTLRDLESAAVLAVGPLSGIGARIAALGSIASRSALQMAALLGGITAAVATMYALTSGALTTASSLERINSALMVSTGNAYLAAQEFNFVVDTSRKLGLELTSVATQYSKLAAATKGSKLEGEATRKIFTSVASAGAALKLSVEQVEGAFRAVQQMISKGNVQAEELRGQFAERVVGGFKLAAKAMNVTTSELSDMLKQGKVLAEDLLPFLSRELTDTFGPQAVKNVETLQGATNVLKTEVILFHKAMNDLTGASDTARKFIQALSGSIRWMGENLPLLVSLLAATSAGFAAIYAPVIIGGFVKLIAMIKSMTVAMLGLNAATMANPFGALAAVLSRVILFAAGATAGFVSMRGALSKSSDGYTELNREVRAFIEVSQAEGRALEDNRKKYVNAVKERIVAAQLEVKAYQARLRTIIKERDAAGKRGIASRMLTDITDQIKTLFGSEETVGFIQGQLAGTNDELGLLVKQLDELQGIKGVVGEIDGPPPELVDALKDFREFLETDVGKAFDWIEKVDMLFEAGLISATEWAMGINKAIDDVANLSDEMERQAEENRKLARKYEELADPLLVYREQLLEIAKLLQSGDLDHADAIKAMEAVHEKMEEVTNKKYKERLKEIAKTAKELGYTFSSAFEDALVEGKKLRDILEGIRQDILRIFIRKSITEPVGNYLAGVFGGFLAGGGNASAGRSYIVGEEGPELFTPSQSGRVIPNHALGGDTIVQVSQTIDARGATPGMEAKIRRAAHEGAMQGYTMVINDLRSNGTIRGLI